MKQHQKIIQALFSILFFLVPLILWPFTSELFEFNKMVVVYLLTISIVTVWIIRMIYEKKFIFSRTILDIPLLVFLASQLISTVISIDPQTSLLGYYSRFNGGLLSTICYLLLYWAFVSNIDKKSARKLINVTLWSGAIVSVYGVLERLGIDKKIWVQDVQHRVFSTLGQPNWLAAWLVAIMPIAWVLIIKNKGDKLTFKSLLPHFLSLLFFAVLTFTGSRSGLLGFATVEVVFWIFVYIKSKFTYFKEFLSVNAVIFIAAILLGTQYTPSIFKLIEKNQKTAVTTSTTQAGGTVLENGGTESGVIRKIVWQGAIDVWKHYPIFGTGVETFAYSYYLYRPAAHNLTSEWDYIYNKAHNEYLNFMANSGSVGILAYLTVVGFAIYAFTKNIIDKKSDSILPAFMSSAFIAGYISILVTNFFGFSVVPIQILFFLYPAISIVFSKEEIPEKMQKKYLNANQKLLSWVVVAGGTFLIFITCKYWYADMLYSYGSNYNKVNRQDLSLTYLNKAIKLEPNQSLYYTEIAKSYTGLALAYDQAKQTTVAAQLTEAAIENSIKSVNLSPANVNLKRIEFGIFAMLTSIDPNYLLDARDVLEVAVKQAPTDAKIHYSLGSVYSRTGQRDLALKTLKETIDLKPNYKDARLAYAILLIDIGRKDEAKEQLNYILTKIDPTDTISKQYLETIK